MRLTTGIGIALGGVGGAVAALMGTPRDVAEPAPVASMAARGADGPTGRRAEGEQASASAAASASASAPAPASAPASASASASASAPAAAPSAAAPLDLPATREALLKAEMLCDQKKDFDECARAAQALELGTAGPADLRQAKRFRKIALTHLVTQCETGNSPHACSVLAAKYRSGTELTQSSASADALEKRASELCRFRTAPECPAP